MAKPKSPKSPTPSSTASTITTTTVTHPDGRQYITRVERTKPKYSFHVVTKATTKSAIPEEVELDSKHFTTWPGLLKLLQIIVAVICMIFFSPPLTWFTRILCAVVASCFAITILICLFYLFTLRRVVFPSWNWLKIEMIYTNLAALSYLVASILQIIFTNKKEYEIALLYHDYYHDYIIAGLIGFVNFILYALGGQLLHNQWKRKKNQPQVHIVRTTIDRKGKQHKKTISHV